MPRLSYFFTNNINKLRGAQSAISPGPPQLNKDTIGLPFCLHLLNRMPWRLVKSQYGTLLPALQAWACDGGQDQVWAISGGTSCLPGVSS